MRSRKSTHGRNQLRNLGIGLLLLLVSVDSLSGQVHQPIEPGQKLRVAANNLVMNGRFAGFAADTLLLRTGRSGAGANIQRLPMATVTRLERGEPCPIGLKRCRMKMATILAGVGMLIGGLVGDALGPNLLCDGPCEPDFEEGLAEFEGALIFGTAGAVLGFVSGMFLPKTDWQELNVEEIAVTLRPGSDGGVVLTFSARL